STTSTRTGRSALLRPAGAGDGADGRRHRQPQRDRHDHGREVAEGPDPDVGAGDPGEDHQQPRADEEGRPGRYDLEVVIHQTHLALCNLQAGAGRYVLLTAPSVMPDRPARA